MEDKVGSLKVDINLKDMTLVDSIYIRRGVEVHEASLLAYWII